jgi:hypothetical protein
MATTSKPPATRAENVQAWIGVTLIALLVITGSLAGVGVLSPNWVFGCWGGAFVLTILVAGLATGGTA